MSDLESIVNDPEFQDLIDFKLFEFLTANNVGLAQDVYNAFLDSMENSGRYKNAEDFLSKYTEHRLQNVYRNQES